MAEYAGKDVRSTKTDLVSSKPLILYAKSFDDMKTRKNNCEDNPNIVILRAGAVMMNDALELVLLLATRDIGEGGIIGIAGRLAEIELDASTGSIPYFSVPPVTRN